MGTADEIVAAPTTAIVFEEDLTDSQKANLGTVYTCSLSNTAIITDPLGRLMFRVDCVIWATLAI